MKILAFDTSSSLDSCTIYDSEKGILSEFRFNIPPHKSETMIEIIKFNLSLLNLTLDSIDIIATCGGPGSFTGTRIGIATALGLSKGTSIKCCVVNTLDILAYSLIDHEKIIAFLTTSNDHIYFAEYIKKDKRLILQGYYLKYTLEEFLIFFNANEAVYISEKDSKFNNICFDNILTKSTIIAKIVDNYEKEDFNRPIKAFYF